MVPGERIELSLPKEHDFESCASTNSAIRAQNKHQKMQKDFICFEPQSQMNTKITSLMT